MKRNIFIRQYTNDENRLTEALLDYLSNSNTRILNKFLQCIERFNFKIKDIKQVKFEMQHRGEESVPDASIYDRNNFYIHIEVKRFEHALKETQLKGHLNALSEEPHKRKYLLVVTNDYGEPKELVIFREKHKKNSSIITYLGWSEIYDFVKLIPNTICDKKDIFLRNQYCEYLEEEKMKIAKWPGFSRQDEMSWFKFMHFYENQRLLFRDIKKHIEQQRDWRLINDHTKDNNEFWFGYKAWKTGNSKFFFYIGLRCVKDSICLYAQWCFAGRLREKLAKLNKFKELKEKLTYRGYEECWHGIIFEKKFLIKDLFATKDAEFQEQKILKFVDRCIKDYERCGIGKTLKQI